MTSLVEEVRAMDIVYFSKAFHTVSHNTLIDKLMNYRLDKWSARQSENWLTWTQKNVISITSPAGGQPLVGASVL